MHLWWKCPNCGSVVDFSEELINSCFDADDGEAYFEPETGVFSIQYFAAHVKLLGL